MIRVGQKIRIARLGKGLTLNEVSKATKIKASFLLAIEEGDYKRLPSSAYIKGFLKNYAQYLGLPYQYTLALFKREFNENENLEVMPSGVSGQHKILTNHLRISSSSVIFVFILAVLGYVVFQYRAAFISPSLDVYSPKDGETVKSSVTVEGKTDPNATVFINDKQVSVGANGTFQKDITVFPGTEAIDIVSQNRFGRKTEKNYHLQVRG